MKIQIEDYELKCLLANLKTMRDCLVDAPIDFLGTGSDGDGAEKDEKEWRNKWQNAYIASEMIIEQHVK